MKRRPWTDAEISHARQMEMLGFSFREIGSKLSRTRSSVVHILRPKPKTAQCVDCGTAVFAGGKTGRCRPCKNRYLQTVPEIAAAKVAGLRRKWAEDGAFAARMRMMFRQIGRDNGIDPKKRAKLVEHGHRMLPQIHSVESRAKCKAKMSRTREKLIEHYMGWCPEEYRDEYKRLTESKRMLAHEARAIILDQVRSDLAKLSPFERQERAIARGAKLVANDRAPMFGEARRKA